MLHLQQRLSSVSMKKIIMKKFSELKVGQELFSTCSISEKELDSYLNFSRVKNEFLESGSSKLVSGRAILSRMEGDLLVWSNLW